MCAACIEYAFSKKKGEGSIYADMRIMGRKGSYAQVSFVMGGVWDIQTPIHINRHLVVKEAQLQRCGIYATVK